MKVVVTGGAGFIGAHAVRRYLSRGDEVVMIDNLSRRGTETNLSWLREQGSFTFIKADVRDPDAMHAALAAHADAGLVLHLAGQVAVTTSVKDPREDFECNALGTFNLLEAVRRSAPHAIFIYASTNKVYGGLEDLGIAERGGRYQFADLPNGLAETRAVDFHSPYGCSKGAADQYVRDYARIYGMRTVSLRQSCIYGPRQFGVEDQGWVAWFTIAALLDRPITVYGDGKQVRDVLFVEDLCDAYDAAVSHIDRARGRVYNIGGGPANQLSLLELLAHLEERCRRRIPRTFDATRPGDQPVFVCDIRAAGQDLDWRPRTPARDGVDALFAWVESHRSLLTTVLGATHR
jgi:CDP-paratose 2-epimerase